MLSKKLLISIIVMILAYAPAAFSQANPADSHLSINESNLFCFQNLQCLVQENPFKTSNLDEVRLNQGTERYVIEGKAKNEEMYAEYDGRNGNLIKATVIQRNIPLPKNITSMLANSDYSEWAMVGNTRVIKNFQQSSIRYEVVLMKEGELRIEHFDANGEMINQLI